MPLYEGEVPEALNANLGTLYNMHPYTPDSWNDVDEYVKRLRFVREATIVSERFFVRKYGTNYVGARAAFVIAKDTVDEELNNALTAIAHRDSGGCENNTCNENCYIGLSDKRSRFFCALKLISIYFARESPED